MTAPPYVDVSKKEALAIMARAQYRLGTMAWWGENLEINFDGTWRVVCRTDECDDVCTGRPDHHKDLEDWIKYFKKRVIFGARIYTDRATFAAIDAISDG